MVAVSGALIFAGYQLLCYGWSQVNGSNAGFFDILWPGRYQGNTPDTAGSGTETPTGLNNVAQGGTVGQTQANTNAAAKQLAGESVFPGQPGTVTP